MDRQLGKLVTNEKPNKLIEYRAMFLVDEDNRSKYKLVPGATGMAFFPAGAIFNGFYEKPSGVNWIIIVSGYDSSSVIAGKIKDSDRITTSSYSNSSFTFDKVYFGIRNAQQSDIDNEVYKFATTTKAVLGDLIFENADADDQYGDPSYNAAPFTTASMESCFGSLWSQVDYDLVMAVLTFPCTCILYTVKYLSSSSSADSFASYNGVLSSVPASYAPSGFASGEWKTAGQQLTIVSDNGAMKYIAERKMIRAPEVGGSQLVWDAAKWGNAVW